VAGRLAARRIDQAECVVSYQQAGIDARVVQKALEALMRRGLPAIEGAALVGIDSSGFDTDE
jgi:hypothetical protein